MSVIFSFIGFPHDKWFHKIVFPVYESKIGASLRKVAKDSMEEGELCGIRIKLTSEKKSLKYGNNQKKNKYNSPSLLTWVGIK